MAWTEITTGERTLTLLTTGSVEWNSALQAALGDPQWVDLLWDPEERCLGIRANYITESFPVYSEPDKGEFKIDSGDSLAAAGVSVDVNFSAVPVPTTEPVVGAGPFNPEPVWYITIPE